MNINGFKVGRKIGEGEYGSIFTALDMNAQKTVILKLFNRNINRNKLFCHEFFLSTTDLKNIGSKYMVTIRENGVFNNGCYILTDFFPVNNTYPHFPSKTYSIDDIFEIGRKISESLSILHSKGYVHGNVNLSNVYFMDNNKVVLGHCGTLKKGKGKSTYILPAYLKDALDRAPEAIVSADVPSDYYSLGILLYELIFNKKPFKAMDLKQLQILKAEMKFSIPYPNFRFILPFFERILHSDPSKRIANHSEFIKKAEACGIDFSTTKLGNNKFKSFSPNPLIKGLD